MTAAAPLDAPPSSAASRAPIRRWWSGPAPDLLLAEQIGVLAPEVAARHPETRRRLRSGSWTAYGDVVVMSNGELTRGQAEWMSLLRAGPGTVLAAASVMVGCGVRVAAPPRPQLIIAFGGSVPRFPDADVRRSRVLGPAEVHPSRQPPQLRLPRATIDAASLARRPDDVRALLCAPVQQRRLRVPDLRAAVMRLGPVSGRALMLRTCDDLELGAQSTHELRFTRGLRRARLPQPDRQVLMQRPDGRYYLDCWWERWRLHVEVDGLAHLWVSQWVADTDRANELEIDKDGRRLRIVGHLLWERPAHVMDQVRRALQRGGWTPDA